MRKSIDQLCIAFMAIIFLAGCHDHEDFIAPPNGVIIQFDSTRLDVQEHLGQRIINISFDKPASQDGLLSLLISEADPSRLIIDPGMNNGSINLDVMKGQQSAMFVIKPINNNLDEDDLLFDITISNASQGFHVGLRKIISIKVVDDDSFTSSPHVIANFNKPSDIMNETEPKQLAIQLSGVLETIGSIELAVNSAEAVYGIHYTTSPEAVDGKIQVSPAIGADVATLVIIPINNNIITGETEIIFTIISTSGAIEMGTVLSQSVAITDDELADKPKGYETEGGQWSMKKTYEYDEAGKVKFVHVEKSTPATSNHTQTYYYDPSGRIQKINSYPASDILYTWSGERITKSEVMEHGVLKEYIEYDYDVQGNISGTANFFSQPNGEFKLGFINIYLYYEDNNLFKSQTYIPIEGTQEFTLISTRTYEGYLNAMNPFPMVEILPGTKTQINLPSTYTIEENGMTLVYRFTYEFRDDNLVSKRITTGGNAMEISNYLYY